MSALSGQLAFSRLATVLRAVFIRNLLDFQNGRYLVPFGLGVGRVFRVGKAMSNVWVEPQPTIYHNKPGLPAFQLFMGINFQWAKKKK